MGFKKSLNNSKTIQMNLKILGSSSAGNCYLLESSNESLLIECGVNFQKVKVACDFNIKRIVACVLSHEHLDHAKAVEDVLKAGITVTASKGTHEALGTISHHRADTIGVNQVKRYGNFTIKAFDIKHDVKEPLGFLINHPECGTVLFLTDSYYCEYKFSGLDHILIEANYCQSILDARLQSGSTIKTLRDRVIESHMSLQVCKQTLASYDLSNVKNIVLIHLSDGNSDERRFKKEVEEQTGKLVHIARPGLTLPLLKTAF